MNCSLNMTFHAGTLLIEEEITLLRELERNTNGLHFIIF